MSSKRPYFWKCGKASTSPPGSVHTRMESAQARIFTYASALPCGLVTKASQPRFTGSRLTSFVVRLCKNLARPGHLQPDASRPVAPGGTFSSSSIRVEIQHKRRFISFLMWCGPERNGCSAQRTLHLLLPHISCISVPSALASARFLLADGAACQVGVADQEARARPGNQAAGVVEMIDGDHGQI